MNGFMALPDERKLDFIALKFRYTFLHGEMNIAKNDFSLIKEYADMLVSRIDEFRELYERLADYKSKRILVALIYYWCTFDLNRLYSVLENDYDQYWDYDILGDMNGCNYIDCGAFDGDSILRFTDNFCDYNHIYGFEMSPDTYLKFKANTGNLMNITCINKAVGSRKGKISVKAQGGGRRFNL